MRCLLCGGSMEPKNVEIAEAVEVEGTHRYYIVTDVPVEECRQCGERAYAPQVVKELEALAKQVRRGVPAARTLAVPVYSLQAARD